jgi:hypothetical protein
MMMMMMRMVELYVFSIWAERVVEEMVLSKRVEVQDDPVVFGMPTWRI